MSSASRQRKPRASCDSCNEARVRCSQIRPTCERCIKNKIKCIYGISQRAGRNRASTHNRAADYQTQLAGDHRPSSRDPVLLLQNSSNAQIRDGFPTNPISLFDDLPMSHETPSSNDLPEMFAEMLTADSSLLSGTWNPSDMGSTVSLGNSMADATTCTCISSIFSFFSTHTMLTGANPVLIDACLELGRDSINLCERVLNCIGLSQHHYSSLTTVALFIDRLVAIYDRARQHYHQMLFVLPYGSEASTRSSSSPSLANSMPGAQSDISREDLFACLEGSVRQSAFIGDYQLDKDDYVKLTFEIVLGHLAKIDRLLRVFKNGISRDQHVVSTTTGGNELVPPTIDQKSEYDHQALVCLNLADLIEHQLNITRSGWESTCKEWKLDQ